VIQSGSACRLQKLYHPGPARKSATQECVRHKRAVGRVELEAVSGAWEAPAGAFSDSLMCSAQRPCWRAL
jgi:hypothetical protein